MGEKKIDAGKKDDGSSFVFKIDMHCEGCANKLKKFVKRFPGVEGIKTDCEANKMTVKGKIDAAKLRDSLAEKTNKKVELITPLPKNDDKKSDDKVAEKPKNIESEKPKKEAEIAKSAAESEKSKKEGESKPKEAVKEVKKANEPAVATVDVQN
uniref:Heavy metal-associated isoprenylated plant protein 26 n=1 Tax=Sedum alfredii TaxID=439688 RepID=A0A650AVH8_9MAGN|nr:Heavy metal-associated isoprenylated plant protein 26 [Sedum alfredii]